MATLTGFLVLSVLFCVVWAVRVFIIGEKFDTPWLTAVVFTLFIYLAVGIVFQVAHDVGNAVLKSL